MAKELAFVLLTPYTLMKSRTGGVIGRVLVRTGLDLVAARMFGPSRELVERYAEMIRRHNDKSPADSEESGLLADYVLRSFMPDTATGKPHRVMMLLFEGEDAVAKVNRSVGRLGGTMETAETVRATYGDFVRDESGDVRFMEPAVITGPHPEAVKEALLLWAEYSDRDGGIQAGAVDVPQGEGVEQTLVMLKPDNFKFASIRPGIIIDIFSGSGLRIVGAKVDRMSVEEAEEFYGPVRDVLREKLMSVAGERSRKSIEKDLGFDLPEDMIAPLGQLVGPVFAERQFNQIVQFMTGYWAPDCPPEEKSQPGRERILALVYEGRNAVKKIREILGPTDPRKALPGSVREEYGQDIMVNAAHASDSPENAQREMRIIKIARDTIKPRVQKFYA